jgi:hypothetical protein
MTDPREDLIADLERLLASAIFEDEFGIEHVPEPAEIIHDCLALIDASRARGEHHVLPSSAR